MPKPDSHLYTSEAQGGVRVRTRLAHFTERPTVAAGIMLLAALIAVLIANTSCAMDFHAFWQTPLTLGIGTHSLTLSFEGFVNDFLMAIFFLVVGLEIKYEVTVGALTSARKALLPILAALGGVLVPIVIYLSLNAGGEAATGWGIPAATDIAFALGILSILGDRIPAGLRVFLSTLAIADDIVAIMVIALFYGHAPDVLWLIMTALVMGVLLLLNRLHIYRIRWYVLAGIVLWFCVYRSGIHATIAGVLLAITIPSRSPVHPAAFDEWAQGKLRRAHEGLKRDTPVLAQGEYIDHIDDVSQVANFLTPPLSTMKKALEPFSSFLVLPLFALANAGVSLAGISMSAFLSNTAVLGIVLGLVLGKPVGIMLMSTIAVRCGFAELPEGVTWGHMLGAAVLGGVGFTMSILITGLAFYDPSTTMQSKAAVLLASLIAGVVGFLLLLRQARRGG